MKKVKVICLADESFQKAYPHWQKKIKEVIKFLEENVKVFKFKAEIKKWGTKNFRRRYNDYLKDMDKYPKKDVIIGFTAKTIFWDNPLLCGISYENKIIITNFFPIKIPYLYELGLKKLALHEFGHCLRLNDSYFISFSIMDNFFGIFTSRFTKKQKEKIKKFAKNLKV